MSPVWRSKGFYPVFVSTTSGRSRRCRCGIRNPPPWLEQQAVAAFKRVNRLALDEGQSAPLITQMHCRRNTKEVAG